jgi:Raf kinase inhibitor-like YbhB/YbcL family protein
MKKLFVPLLCALGLSAGVSLRAHALDLSSPDIGNGQTLSNAQVFQGFGCSGGNVSPALSWGDVPAGTKSFAITAYDPDAPTGSGWWHWTAYDLPASLRSLPTGAGKPGALPGGAKQGRNDFGSNDFGGACPPQGDTPHHYIFTVFALKVEKLEVPADASAALIGYMLNANKLATASITARFGR